MKGKPLSLQQQYALDYAKKLKERSDSSTAKSQADRREIGCKTIRIWSKTISIVEWAEKGLSVVVEVDGEVSRYNYPFHPYIAFPFVNFEVLDDCGYLDKFSNGTEYVIGGKRYGVKDDVVWAGTKRYLSSEERARFGSFREFLEKHKDFSTKKCII